MENASKALIIAGAILISILLISLGILIYNQATNITNNKQMDEIEVTSFNSKFTQYEGDKVTGAQVRALINQINTSNSSEDNVSTGRSITLQSSSAPSGYSTVTVAAATGSGSATTYKSDFVSNSGRYKVQIEGYGTDGCVSNIGIYKKN